MCNNPAHMVDVSDILHMFTYTFLTYALKDMPYMPYMLNVSNLAEDNAPFYKWSGKKRNKRCCQLITIYPILLYDLCIQSVCTSLLALQSKHLSIIIGISIVA